MGGAQLEAGKWQIHQSLIGTPGFGQDRVRAALVVRPKLVRHSEPPMTEPILYSESILVRVARGDADGVRACLDRYGALVWSVAKKVGDDIATIEDVVQEVFIDVWKSAGRFDPEKGSEATFIATIARRRVIDRRRRVGRAPMQELIDDSTTSVDDAGLTQVDLGDEARQAREALSELKPEQRRVILMSVVEGLTHPEIASATGIPLGTVKSHIRRGLDQAAQKLRSAGRMNR
ncbi:MAG: RNA polymerase sigma factor (sigma-70 family) [Planctomycetota bacterium]|jgi:RNA polymerase sigma factor (sigma-70 family)